MSNTIKCPKCGSTSLHSDKSGFSLKKSIIGGIALGGLGLLGGFVGSNKIEITCLNCGYKFKPGETFGDITQEPPNNGSSQAITDFATDNKESISRKTRTLKSEPPQKATKFQKVKIETLLHYRNSISDSKVRLLEDLMKEGVVYVEMPTTELNHLKVNNGVKRIISFRELK